MRRLVLFATCIAFAWSLEVACNGDDATGPRVGSVQVAPTSATIAPAATVQLTATVRDTDGNTLANASVSWSTNDATVATVSSTGLVTGVDDGNVAIEASSGGETATANITVITPVASVDVEPTNDTIRAGNTVPLTATTRDAGGAILTGRTVTWSSNDQTIATVDNSGLVTGVDNGTATITATSEGQDGTAAVAVWVGTTGEWAGQVDAGGGGNFCPLTQSLTEDPTGAISGSGTLGNPCTPGPYTIVGMNNVDGVADSVVMSWTGNFALTLSGNFDGVSMMSGEITGGGCNPGDCPFTFTRSSIVPVTVVAPSPPVATPDRPRPGVGVLGRQASQKD